MILFFILCLVNLTSRSPFPNENSYETPNNSSYNESTTAAPPTSNGTTIIFETNSLNTTTPPLTVGEIFFLVSPPLIGLYLIALSLLTCFTAKLFYIDFLMMVPMFKKHDWVTLIEWLDYFQCVAIIFSYMNVILFPIVIIGILLPLNSWPENAFRYFVVFGLLSSMTLFLICILIRLLVLLMSVCMDTTDFKTYFLTRLKMTEEKSNKTFEIMFRLISVLIRLVIKILLSPISFIYKKCKAESIRMQGEHEGTIKTKIWIYCNIFLMTSKPYLPVFINVMLIFFVLYQNDRNADFLIEGAKYLIAFVAFMAIISIKILLRSMQDKKMKTQADGDFHNGLPEVDPDHYERLQSVLDSITSNYSSLSMVRHDNASDSLCKCRLRLGSSDTYKRLVKIHKASGARTKNSLENVFITAKQKQLLKKVESEEKRNYERIVNGEEKELVVSPPMFQFNSKIGLHETIEQHTIQDIFHKIKNQDPNEAEEINKFLKDIKWQIAEWDIFNELVIFFSQKQGVMVNGYETHNFLKPFVKEAEDYRKQNSGLKDLTDLEKQILQALNIDLSDVNDAADGIVNELAQLFPGPTFLTSDIHSEIKKSSHKLLTKDAKNKAKNKFKNKKVMRSYAAEEIRIQIKYSIYQAHSKYTSEWDFIVILPSSKTIVNVEVKNNADAGSGKNSNLVCASEQLEKHAIYFAEKHGYLIDEKWSFLKIASIKPKIDNKTLACSHCEKFVITNDHHIGDVWRNIQFSDLQTDKDSKKNLQNDFVTLFRRLVSYSSVSRTTQPKSLSKGWEQVEGDRAENITSGYTEPPPLYSEQPLLSEIRQMAHNAYKAVYFNPGQFGLLFGRLAKRLVVFLSDFGTGKTLIAKEKALREAEQSGSGLVYFISLIASDQTGFPEKFRYIFDIVSENYDFKGTNVQYYDVNRLWEEYQMDHPNAKKDQVDVFELATDLISKNQGSSFIVDEVPIYKEKRIGEPYYTAESIKRTEDFLLDCINLVQDPNIFWAALQANCLSDVVELDKVTDALSEPFNQLKQSLISENVHIGNLSVNMRNTKEIHDLEVMPDEIGIQAFASDKFRTNAGLHKANPTTVVGAIPTVIPVKKAEFSGSIKEILKKCLKTSNGSSKPSNTVLLHDNAISTYDIVKNLKTLDSFDDVVSYPSSNDPQTCQNGLYKFLRDERIALVTHEKFFRGCEAKNVVYFCENGENVRSSTARAVEGLVIVQKLRNEYSRNEPLIYDNHIFKNSRITKFLSHPNPFYRILNRLEDWTSNII